MQHCQAAHFDAHSRSLCCGVPGLCPRLCAEVVCVDVCNGGCCEGRVLNVSCRRLVLLWCLPEHVVLALVVALRSWRESQDLQ